MVAVLEEASEMWEKMMKGDFGDVEKELKGYYECMADDLALQRKQIGGDWAIAQAVFSRTQRDFLRNKLGPNLVFIVLNLTKECQKKRVAARHGDSLGADFLKVLEDYAALCEPAGADEPNAYNLDIDENMSRDDVIKKLLEIVQKAY